MFDHGAHTETDEYTDTGGVPIEIADGDGEEADVQIKLTRRGTWHRKLIGIGKMARVVTTACGESAGGFAVRDETYAGDLCRAGCFSSYELSRNDLTDTITDD